MKFKILILLFCLIAISLITPSMINATGTVVNGSTLSNPSINIGSNTQYTSTGVPTFSLADNSTGVFHGRYTTMRQTSPALKLYVLVTLKYRNYDHLLQFLTDVQTPGSPTYHHFLSKSDFIAQYSPDLTLYTGLKTYFQNHGLTVKTYNDRVSLALSGTVAQFEQIFHTQISLITTVNTTFYAPVQSLSLDYNTGGNIQNIIGLSNESHAQISPLFTNSGGLQLLYGADLQNAYQLNQLYTEKATYTGQGYPTTQTIAIILWDNYSYYGPYNPVDINYYFQHNFPSSEPQPNVCGNPIDGAPAPGSSADNIPIGVGSIHDEATLDIEMVGSTAPGANIVFVYGPSSDISELDNVFATILNPGSNPTCSALANPISAITNSWGSSMATFDSTWDSYEKEAAALGITVFASSGDSGGSSGELAIPFPSASAYDSYGTIAVGGTQTTLTGSQSSDGTGTTGIQSQSAWSGSQGGLSVAYQEPNFQATSADANTVITNAAQQYYTSIYRATPDVAAVGTQMQIYITGPSGSTYEALSGTSISSPLMAGVVASMNYYLGMPEGFFDPTIYQLGQEQYAGGFTSAPPFFDVTTGSNYYFPALHGYDLVTGWGSINAYNFILDQQFLNNGGGVGFDSFENGQSGVTTDGWVFANSGNWQTSHDYSEIGFYSLKELDIAGSNGLQFDTVQNQMFTMTDGSIQGWVYIHGSGSQYKTPAFWIRTGTQYTGNQGPCNTGGWAASICTGYGVYLYINHAVLFKMTPSGGTGLASYTLPSGYVDQWWHVKLETVGSTINVWVDTSATFTSTPQISITDSTYTSGYTAFSGRTNFAYSSCYEYFDGITIQSYAKTTEPFESYPQYGEPGLSVIQADGWNFANVGNWQTSTNYFKDGSYSLQETDTAGSNGLQYDTVQYGNAWITDGSIEGWIYVSGTVSQYKTPALWIRTGTQYTGNQGPCNTGGWAASICTGYGIYLYIDHATLFKMTPSGGTGLASYTLNSGYVGQWWHVKLQAAGSRINAWVDTSATFTSTPQISITDSTYTSGYTALSGRTNFAYSNCYEYFDAFTIYWSS